VDFAIMEPVSSGRGSAHIVAVALPIRWSDVGGFPALAEHLPTDEAGNAVDGASVLVGTRTTTVVNRAGGEHLGAALDRDDITLVCPRSSAEKIKALVGTVGEQAGEQYT